jgi:dihydropteroate synthase
MSAPLQNPPLVQSVGATVRALRCGAKTLSLGDASVMVGILNVTTDSFFDGGRFAAVDAAIAQGLKLVEEGAGMIDLGGQSTRPGHVEISAEEEIARVLPVLTELARQVSVPISIDTSKPAVARAALQVGAGVVNDIHGFQRDPELATIAAESGAAAILMHFDPAFRDTPGDVIEKLKTFLGRSIDLAVRSGVAVEQVVLDPGIGFGKTQEQNLEIMGRIGELRALGCPVLLGASRKSVIGNVLTLPVEERLEGTLATTALAAWHGVELIRVHDVQANLRVARMTAAIRRATFS